MHISPFVSPKEFLYNPTDPKWIRPDILHILEEYKAGRQFHLGDFLTGLLSKDMSKAFGHADNDNLITMPALYSWCYNNLPMNSWGSSENVNDWLSQSYFHKIQETADNAKN